MLVNTSALRSHLVEDLALFVPRRSLAVHFEAPYLQHTPVGEQRQAAVRWASRSRIGESLGEIQCAAPWRHLSGLCLLYWDALHL